LRDALRLLSLHFHGGFLTLENGAPSHDVIRNAFMAVRPESFVEILATWAGDLDGVHVAIDGKVQRTTVRPGTDGREAVIEDHCYLRSVLPDDVRLAALVRGHRGAENRYHWTLDVTFGEDLCGTRDATASRNLSSMREMAIAMLRAHPSKKTLPLK
jgi:predicted transposase YbfD/YdcC